eukprot:1073832-Karenia_brevis.AAC.1
MAGCGKGPHCVRQLLSIEILQASFCSFCNRVKEYWRCMASSDKSSYCVRQPLRNEILQASFRRFDNSIKEY